MIESRLAVSEEDTLAVKKAMPRLGTMKALCIYGYWDGEVCVGGSYLQDQFPNDLVMEFYTSCPTIVKAIGESYSGMLKIKPQLNAHISIDNYKSLKMVRMLGFKQLYTRDNQVAVQFNKENWRYSTRYALT